MMTEIDNGITGDVQDTTPLLSDAAKNTVYVTAVPNDCEPVLCPDPAVKLLVASSPERTLNDRKEIKVPSLTTIWTILPILFIGCS